MIRAFQSCLASTLAATPTISATSIDFRPLWHANCGRKAANITQYHYIYGVYARMFTKLKPWGYRNVNKADIEVEAIVAALRAGRERG